MSITVWISEDDEEVFVVYRGSKPRLGGRAMEIDEGLVARYERLKPEWEALQDELAEIYTKS